MKIISKTKDYYDWVGKKYGGGDPLATYDRRWDPAAEETITTKNECISGWFGGNPIDNCGIEGVDGYTCSACIVNAKRYPLISTYTYDARLDVKTYQPWRLVHSPDDIFFTHLYPATYRNLRWGPRMWGWNQRQFEEMRHGLMFPKEQPHLITLSRELQRPVFQMAGSYTALNAVPNLGELGFASAIPAEQMYQEIAYFVGNLLRESPDLSPPAAVSDADRLRQHGFDPKRSFRH